MGQGIACAGDVLMTLVCPETETLAPPELDEVHMVAFARPLQVAAAEASRSPRWWVEQRYIRCPGRTVALIIYGGRPRDGSPRIWRRPHVRVEAINIGPSDAIAPVGSVTAVAGVGLRGDRHFYRDGAPPGQALTLIEAEALEEVILTGAQSRRQVVVRGVRLNELVGRRFRVGEVDCLGVELCEPCLHLQQLTRPGIIKDLIHRAGINADILTDGVIRVGDEVVLDA
jgi:hypothetical protein